MKFLEVNLNSNPSFHLVFAPTSVPRAQSSISAKDKWRKLVVDFEDLTLEFAASPWDTHLDSRRFMSENLSLFLLTPVVRRLCMAETCEAMANHSLKRETLATSLSKVYAGHDVGRERLEADVSRLKLLLEKSQNDLEAGVRAKVIVEEKKTRKLKMSCLGG